MGKNHGNRWFTKFTRMQCKITSEHFKENWIWAKCEIKSCHVSFFRAYKCCACAFLYCEKCRIWLNMIVNHIKWNESHANIQPNTPSSIHSYAFHIDIWFFKSELVLLRFRRFNDFRIVYWHLMKLETDGDRKTVNTQKTTTMNAAIFNYIATFNQLVAKYEIIEQPW